MAESISTGTQFCSARSRRTTSIAGQAGQHDVQYDGVEVAEAGLPQTLRSGVGDLDREPLGNQAAAQRLDHPLLVVDQQQAHAPILCQLAPAARLKTLS